MAFSFRHGRNGYVAHRCRCDVCRTAAMKYAKKYVARKKEKKIWLEDGFKHGSWGYALGCRCDACILEYNSRRKVRRWKDIEETRRKEREYLRQHAEEHRVKVRRYHKKHPEKLALRTRRYRLAHKTEICGKAKQYRKTYADKIRDAQRAYQRAKYDTDIAYRLLKNLRSRMGGAIERGTKSAHTLELLGCSMEELTCYLESLFQPGMTWGNKGKWHIDHKIPCSRFDLSKPEEQRKCFHFSNLQPLWAEDNRRKGNKMVAA